MTKPAIILLKEATDNKDGTLGEKLLALPTRRIKAVIPSTKHDWSIVARSANNGAPVPVSVSMIQCTDDDVYFVHDTIEQVTRAMNGEG